MPGKIPQKHGRVQSTLFCINSPIVRCASSRDNVGIAVGGIASDIAVDTADVVLMNEDISKLPSLIRRSKKTMSVIRFNVFFSITLKILIAILAAFGLVTLWIALILGDMGLTIAVVLNALRITRDNSHQR